jgi:hypothetical protein
MKTLVLTISLGLLIAGCDSKKPEIITPKEVLQSTDSLSSQNTISPEIIKLCGDPNASSTCLKNSNLFNPIVGKKTVREVKISIAQCAGLFNLAKVVFEQNIVLHPKGNQFVALENEKMANEYLSLARQLPGDEDVFSISNEFNTKIIDYFTKLESNDGSLKAKEFIRDVTWSVYLTTVCGSGLLNDPEVKNTIKDVNLN